MFSYSEKGFDFALTVDGYFKSPYVVMAPNGSIEPAVTNIELIRGPNDTGRYRLLDFDMTALLDIRAEYLVEGDRDLTGEEYLVYRTRDGNRVVSKAYQSEALMFNGDIVPGTFFNGGISYRPDADWMRERYSDITTVNFSVDCYGDEDLNGELLYLDLYATRGTNWCANTYQFPQMSLIEIDAEESVPAPVPLPAAILPFAAALFGMPFLGRRFRPKP